jgi:hypothetical protein
MQGELETDYLVVGAGAGGMAFTDALLTHSDATVTLVDRRHAPGGQWLDAYPFVRLHQPSAFYGVDSVPLGQDAIDSLGANAGFYERAGADELRAYYERVMHRHFLPTGRVKYFPCSDYVGEHRFVSRLSGATTQVRVRKKLVDTTYIEGSFPATTAPPFEVAESVRCMSPTAFAKLEKAPERVVVIGGGKTALDTCVWLLENGVAPSAIRWVRPREGWWLNRKFQQPHTLLPDLLVGAAIQIEAMALAQSIDDLFERLESQRIFFRLDPSVEATMFHGAIMTEHELTLLRRIEGVIRMGRVQQIERDAIVLERGRVPTDDRTVHIHCAVSGVQRRPPHPTFEKDRVTLQPFGWSFSSYQFALLGVLEALVESDDEKNGLCPAMTYWDTKRDYLSSFLATMIGERTRSAHPKIAAWSKASRLNPAGGISAHRDDPRVVESRERVKRYGMDAAANLMKLLS